MKLSGEAGGLEESLTRTMTILAQDPTVKVDGKILTAEAEIPREVLGSGPRGYRVYVVDFDASSGLLYRPAIVPVPAKPVEQLVKSLDFHAQNVYAIVMRTLARFEFALGRRVSWSFDGHQIHVAPHGFAEANAFYSKRDRGLFFGYFDKDNKGNKIFTCLSHDVVAHETTHALLDGLRMRYTFPSSPDQAAFHEGFADVVALLSIFSLSGVVEELLDENAPTRDKQFIDKQWLTRENLLKTALFGLGEEVDPRRTALRRSAAIPPSKEILEQENYKEAHNRGEVFVAIVMNSFLNIWLRRIRELGDGTEKRLLRTKVAEEGSTAADHLLTMVIRALDYCPVTDLLFGDFWSALITSDYEIQPSDAKYHYREVISESFEAYGIEPAPSRRVGGKARMWEAPGLALDYSKTHFESMKQDPDEVFRFLWENRKGLGLCEDAYTRVQSVRPCLRLSIDGFLLRETVAEYVQILNLNCGELKAFGIKTPPKMPEDTPITLYGGGALIFSEYGQLKYHVRTKVLNKTRQSERLAYLWDSGFFDSDDQGERRFSEMHRLRLMAGVQKSSEEVHDHGQFF
jgi:hypothetical protein